MVRIPKLARQLKKNAHAREDAVADRDEPEVAAAALHEQADEPPPVVSRPLLASRSRSGIAIEKGSDGFGKAR